MTVNKILFCRIGWMKQYKGTKNDRIINGGEYNKNNFGHEAYNFANYNGNYYGFVEQGVGKKICIEKLGADKNSDFVENVLVVFVATSPNRGQYIVGWYNNAIVYRDFQEVPQDILVQRENVKFHSYNLYSEDVIFIPENERKCELKYKCQRNIYYGDEETIQRALNYIYKETVSDIEQDTKNLVGKEKDAKIKVRVNQGIFRGNLLQKYNKCCLCNIEHNKMLIASHIKPWRECEPEEKLDIDNGLLLCPNHDKLFDLNFISFDDSGKIKISDKINPKDYNDLNISNDMSIEMTQKMKKYMKFHRERLQN